MAILKENEWNRINEILLEIYSIDVEYEIAKTFILMMRSLITCSHAFFVMCDEEGKIEEEKSYFFNFEENIKKEYIDYYSKIDYINYIFDYTSSVICRDTDIMENKARQNSEFYKGFLKPNHIEYGAGIVFAKEGKMIGEVNLFKSEELGDFTEKDIYMLNIFKSHLENIIHSLKKNSKTLDGRKQINEKDMEHYNLSKREYEIMNCMLNGASNQEISQELMISLSTVKKHVYNIFTKLGINSRIQLYKIIKGE